MIKPDLGSTMHSLNPWQSVLLHFSVCPMIAFIGAAFATGFPFVPNNSFAHDIWWVQFCAIVTACITSLVTAYVLRSSEALRRGLLVRHFGCLFVVLVGNHFLWVEPVWGFHHDHTLGIFAWLFIGGDDGFSIFPNVLGLPITILGYWMLHSMALSFLACPVHADP